MLTLDENEEEPFLTYLYLAAEDAMTTPPLPSSPAPAMDIMDMSPLPHKPPFTSTPEIELNSPMLESSPMDTSMMSNADNLVPESPTVPLKDGQQE